MISPKSTAPPSTTPSRSNSRVTFDLESNMEFPHDEQRRAGSRDRRSYSDSEETVTSHQRSDDRKSRRRNRKDRDPASQLFNDKYDRTPSGYESDVTTDLPPRFDRDGNRKPESTGNELADRIQDLLAGKGTAGSFLRGCWRVLQVVVLGIGRGRADGTVGGGGGIRSRWGLHCCESGLLF
jgi:hypothetical protein